MVQLVMIETCPPFCGQYIQHNEIYVQFMGLGCRTNTVPGSTPLDLSMYLDMRT